MGRGGLNDRKLTIQEYVAALQKAMDVRTDSAKVIFIKADDTASYGQMVQAIDAAKGAGVLVIGMSTLPPVK